MVFTMPAMTYPRHLEVSQYTPSLSTKNTPVPDLGRACVAVHLGQLQLGDGARASGEGGVADDVAEGLSAQSSVVSHWVGKQVGNVGREVRYGRAEVGTSRARRLRRPCAWNGREWS